MLSRLLLFKNQSSEHGKIASLTFTLLLIFMADGILSYFVPNFLETKYGAFWMGIIMSFSSVVGLSYDLIFPQLSRSINLKRFLAVSILLCGGFILALYISDKSSALVFPFIAVGIWGIYWEMIRISKHDYIAKNIATEMHATAWGIFEIARGFAYTVAPILTSYLILKSTDSVLFTAFFFVIASLIAILLRKNDHVLHTDITHEKINLFTEFSKWVTLNKRIYTLVISTVLIGLVDSFIWTIGAVWSEDLSKVSFWGTLLIPLYILPTILTGLFLARIKIVSGKKKLSEFFLLLSGLSLGALYLFDHDYILVFIIFISSIFLALSYPLSEAVYSDLEERMGIKKRHLISLSLSTISLSYIIGPSIAGFLSSLYGEKQTFVYLGLFTAGVAVILLLLTPRKLKLPQNEIESWK